MRKRLLGGVKPVGVLGKLCGQIRGFYIVLGVVVYGGVYKAVGYTRAFTRLLRPITHSQNTDFQTVSGVVLPTIHSTYNKLLLNKFIYSR